MIARRLDIYSPEIYSEFIDATLKKHNAFVLWKDSQEKNILHHQIFIPADECESILDAMEAKLSGVDGFRIIIIPVEAIIPRLQDREEREKKIILNDSPRVSREELYSDIVNTIDLNWVYLALVVLSTFVAAVGLIKDSVAVIIGAMVIAPLLGPNVGLALATSLADLKLGLRAALTLSSGLFLAMFLAILMGVFLDFDPMTNEIAMRTKVSYGDLVVALASGSVGVLAFTTALPTMLVGVMVAVALLPPLVTTGLLLGAGHFEGASGAALLLLTNLICVNLAGVITFYIQGVRPLTWWDAEKAKKATWKALIIWLLLLVILIVLITISN